MSRVPSRLPLVRSPAALIGVSLLLVLPSTAHAQRASENAVTGASDGFGASIGNERVGIYSPTSVRGFSPITAGNRRLDGLYFDMGGNGLTSRLTASSAVRVGLTALAYPFPAPSGIVDYQLRPSGDRRIVSVVGGRTNYGGSFVEVDAQLPLIPGRASVAVGGQVSEGHFADGRTVDFEQLAIIPRLTFDRGSLTAFYGYAETSRDGPALMTTTGPALPPVVDTSKFYSQPWASNRQQSDTYGLLGHLALRDDLTLRVGAFESRSIRVTTFDDLFLNIQPDGTARNVMVAERDLPARWTSGEARLTWVRDAGPFDHAIHLSVRGRDKRLVSGGGGSAVLGTAVIGEYTSRPEPDFVFGTPTISEVRQLTGGVAWVGRWSDRAEVNIGVQKTDYRLTIHQRGVTARTEDSPWLYNATVALSPRPWLAFYAGAATGIEETRAPPLTAVNRDDAVPASRTEQQDAGVRIALGRTRVVAGVFQIERPYYGVGADGLYKALGDVTNRGVEISVVGQLTDRLSIVGGLVLLDAEVTGEAVDSGRVGKRSVATSNRSGRIDVEYRTPFLEGLSLTAGIQHTGPTIASTAGYAQLGGGQLEVPAWTTLDLGARYRFTVGETPVSARLLLANVFDDAGYNVVSGNSFQLRETRRLSLQFSADF